MSYNNQYGGPPQYANQQQWQQQPPAQNNRPPMPAINQQPQQNRQPMPAYPAQPQQQQQQQQPQPSWQQSPPQQQSWQPQQQQQQLQQLPPQQMMSSANRPPMPSLPQQQMMPPAFPPQQQNASPQQQPHWQPQQTPAFPPPPNQQQYAPQHLQQQQQQPNYGMPPLPQALQQPPAYGQQQQQPISAVPSGANYAQQLADRPIIPRGVSPINPRYLSLTAGAVPKSDSIIASSKLPLGVVLHPMAQTGEELEVVNFGQTGVVRCAECRAYINPYVLFVDGGARWRCNLCGRVNDVPNGYYSPLDNEGNRKDMHERAELCQSSFEVVAPAEYMMRPPMPPIFVFLIDVSFRSVQSGLLKVLCQTVKETLDHLPGDERTQIGFITFDSALHFYSFKGSSQRPQMHVLSDLDDIFLPSPSDMVVSLHDCRDQVDALLDAIPEMHANTHNVESALGPALTGAEQLMNLGGKLLVFLSGLSSLGEGRLANREDPRVLGTAQEHVLFQPANDFYTRKALNFMRKQTSVDVFFFADEYIDMATIGTLSRYSGGQTYHYSGFRADLDGDKFAEDLRHNLTRETGWEAVVRIRCSAGIKLHNYYGNFYLRGQDLLALPTVDADKTYAAELSNPDGKAVSARAVSIQAALLYTTSTGERRIRVHTTCVPVVSTIQEIWPSVNTNAVINLLAKQAVERSIAKGLQIGREHVRNSIVSILRGYLASQRMQGGQLPPHLATMPVMALGLLKCAALIGGTDVHSDQRSQAMNNIRFLGITPLETFVRPMIMPIQTLQGSVGLADEKSGTVQLPPEINLTAQDITDGSAVLIDNGFSFFLRLSKTVNRDFLQEVFGISSLDGVDTRQLQIRDVQEKDETSLLRRVHNILDYLRSLSPSYQTLHVFKEGDPAEIAFYSQLIEDRSRNEMSLGEFTDRVFQSNY